MTAVVSACICLIVSLLVFVDGRILQHPKSKIIIKNLHPTTEILNNLTELQNFKWSDYQQNTPWDAINFCSSLYVSPLITSDMILQRGSPGANIFGWGLPGSVISVEFNGKMYQSTAGINDNSLDACSWKIQLPPMTFSQHDEYYTITISSNAPNATNVTFHNIQFGDIWVCSGATSTNIVCFYP